MSEEKYTCLRDGKHYFSISPAETPGREKQNLLVEFFANCDAARTRWFPWIMGANCLSGGMAMNRLILRNGIRKIAPGIPHHKASF